MKKVILSLSLFSVINCTGLSQIRDVGYKADCLESYADIIYESLLPIIDSITFNELIKKNVNFGVQVSFSTKTGYPNEILIMDSSNVLSDKKKEEYKSILSKIQFDLCHSEHDVHELSASKVFTGESVGVYAGSFYVWWYRKNVLYRKN